MASDRTLNPFAEVTTERERGEIVALTIVAPVRGRGLQTSTFRREDGDERFRAVRRAVLGALFDAQNGGDPWRNAALETREVLSFTGLLIVEEERPRAVEFVCRLDDLSSPPPAEPLLVNPSLGFASLDAPGFARAEAVAHVQGAGQLPVYIWLGGRERAIVAGLAPGREPPTMLDSYLAGRLIRAGVLVTARGFEAEQRARERVMAAAAADYLRRGVAVLPSVVPPPTLGALQRYFRDLVAEGFTTYGDDEGDLLRWIRPNDPVARVLHPSVAAVVAAVTGQEAKPSFSYLLNYLEGAELGLHKDREQCELTASLQIDFLPAPPDGVAPWPIYFETADGPEPLRLPMGGAVVFKGHAIAHYRGKLVEGRSATNLTFCFVPPSFSGPLD